MPLPAASRALADKVDAYIARVGTEQDEFRKAVFAKWLVMLTAGFVEKSLQEILKNYTERRGNREVAHFVSRQVAKYLSINMDKMEEILGGFSAAWPKILRAQVSDAQVEALNSVKNLRDLFAHGSDNGVRWSTAVDYWKAVRALMEVVEAVVP